MNPRFRKLIKLGLILAAFAVSWDWGNQFRSAIGQEVQFATEIQPILARRCYACHGPDTAESGLRLNSHEAASAELDSGSRAIVPGQPEASELLARIRSTEEGVRMPPEGKPLTIAEQERIERWIAQGAVFKQHWAFDELSDPEPPKPASDDSPVAPSHSNPVDAFIDAKLAAKGLKLAPRAEYRELLRRLSYDLIGLPPTYEQTVDFERRANENFEAAWESEIDRLLASEHYGERWARHWLDVVRYAETNSFERDGPKPNAWRYRDYVIRSFNEDKPYDRFLMEQLAGDELPDVTKDSLIATGFYRLGTWDDEPADRELAMYDGFDDILTTVGQGILGLTLNCSRCHDHKIDPIPAKDYYSALAFFRNLTPNGYGPQVERPLVASQEDRARYAANEAAIREEGNRLQMRLSEVEALLRQDLETDPQTSGFDLDEVEFRFYRDTFAQLPDFDTLKPETVGKLEPPLLDIGLATRPDDFGFVFVGKLIVPQDGEYSFRLDSDDGSKLTINGQTLIHYDGIHGVGSPRRAKLFLSAGRHDFRLDYFQGGGGKGLYLDWSGPGFRRHVLTREPDLKTVDLNQLIQTDAASKLNPELVAEYKKLRKSLEANSRKKPWDEYGMCVSESGTQAPDTHILVRGSPQAQGDRVVPSFPSIFGGETATVVPSRENNSTGRRLAFARWVTSPEHRLTSRVFVNRIWQHHFGRGIVRTPNNFGQLGDPPTHPELLDYLAREFVAGGWRMKPLHKTLLMSRTYLQTSLVSEDAMELDPNNDLFSRFDMRRLSAEEIRDSILFANGRINLKLYGPSIYPELSQEVLASQSIPGKGWEKTSYKDQARRSVYIHVKRSLLVPMMANFDFPEPDSSCEARFITTQPGQALGMLNGDFLNQQATELAKRMREEAGEQVQDQIDQGFQLVLSREPTASERARSLRLIEQLETEHGLSREMAMANFALFLFNVNEFVYVD
jgi:hypothetical protein